MLYPSILALHIGAALATGVAAVFALYVLALGKQSSFRLAALVIGFIAAFEVLSGTALAVLSPEITAVYLSAHIALYLGSCIFVEFLLFAGMERISLAFPFRLTLSPVFASVLLFVAAVSYGF